jgi:release factor glutamine methyltransferase
VTTRPSRSTVVLHRPATACLDTRQTAWAWGAARLGAAGLAGEEARLEAEVLLRHAAALTREELFTRPADPLPPQAAASFAALIEQRATGRPTAYLVGHREFFGAKFMVDERVLIPRPETECLVEVVRDGLVAHLAPVIVEIGTGSGAVAITLARLLPRARVIATDCSGGALEMARMNAARLGVADRITWIRGDGLLPLAGLGLEDAVDAVVSNPPYVRTSDLAVLPREVREHEPRAALDGGPDGLSVHRAIIGEADRYLRASGALVLEVAALGDQARAVAALVAARPGFAPPRIVRDYAGLDRIVVAARGGEA